jgi:hypothetical protein
VFFPIPLGHIMATTVQSPAPTRLMSVDAYRGLVMLLLMGEALRLSRVARTSRGTVCCFTT